MVKVNGMQVVCGKTELYSSERDAWFKGPDLNEARESHSSCALGSRVYVFGGLGGLGADKKSPLDSIEYFNA